MAREGISDFTKKEQVIAQIEDLVRVMLQHLAKGQPLTIPLRTTPSTQDKPLNLKSYCFPYNSYPSAWRFTVVLRILDIIHETLVEDRIVSKRDVYYQDPNLFRSQPVVNRHLNNLAMTFDVSMKDLNVIAEIRGLVAGPLMVRKEESPLENSVYVNPEGTPVPRSNQFQSLLISSTTYPRFLLLVEKRATFHTLSQSNFHIRHNCVLLTGQGYPDLTTRVFLHYFDTRLAPNIPCYALVDFDPDGLCIYNVYTRGSQASSNEIDVTVPDLHLLGLRAEEALSLLAIEIATVASQASRNDTATDVAALDGSMNLPYLSRHERQRAKGLLKRLTDQVSTTESYEAERVYMQEQWNWQEHMPRTCTKQQADILIRELQVCLMMGYKVEIEILSNKPEGLENWVLERVAEQPDRS